jgi:hypothetical protein
MRSLPGISGLYQQRCWVKRLRCSHVPTDVSSAVKQALRRLRNRAAKIGVSPCVTGTIRVFERLATTGLERAFNGTSTAGHIIAAFDKQGTVTVGLFGVSATG